MIENKTIERSSNLMEYSIKHIEFFYEISEKNALEELKKAVVVCKNNVRPKTLQEAKEEDKARAVVALFGKDKLKEESSDVDSILSRFKFIGLTKAFKKFQTQEALSWNEESAVIHFANTFTSVCLSPKIVGEKVVNIVKKVNQHRHTKACRKYQTECRFSFPKYPVWKTLISCPNNTLSETEKASHEKILFKVREVLSNQELIDNIMQQYNKSDESEELFYINREKRIKQLLSVIGYDKEEDWNLYLDALSYSKRGYSVVLQRDIDEVFVNSFNAEWISAWQGNIDLQICLDFFAVITYITDYFTKDDTGTMEILVDSLKNSEFTDLKDKMALLMNTFITHRQMGEAEAVYKIFPDFHFKESNISTVYLPNCPQSTVRTQQIFDKS